MFSHILSSSPSGLSPLHGVAAFRASCSLQSNTIRLNHIRNVCTLRFLDTAHHGLSVGLIPIVRRKKPLGVVGTSNSADRGEDNGRVDENITDDALRSTIIETKRILELHKNLLGKIAEKRKLELSTSKCTKEEEPASYDENDGSFSDLGIEDKDEDGRINNSWSSSDNFAQLSTEDETADDDYESIGELKGEESVAGALGLSREVNFEQSQPPVDLTQSQLFPALLESQTLPVLHEEPESYFLNDENLRNPSEAYVLASNEQQETPPEKPLAGDNVMNIIMVAAECAPWSKTGGLGDVAGALPKALARRGHRVMVVVPRYEDYAEGTEVGERRSCEVDGQDIEFAYYHAYIDNVDFVFIDSPIFRNLGKDIYDGEGLAVLKRMMLLCKVAVEVPWHVPCGGVCYGDGNLVFLANDWHTALLPVYLRAYYREKGHMGYTRCVLVVHNISYQGRSNLDDFRHVDLPDDFMVLFKHDDPIGGIHFNTFAAGLKTADRIIIVSKGYAWEVKTPDGGRGMDKLMTDIDWKSHGIVNGIDTTTWNPQCDVYLQSDGYTNYTPETFQIGKAQCKAALQQELGLAVRPDVPVISFIGRLDYQKGVDIIADAMQWFSGQDIQLIMLGAGRLDLEDKLRGFEQHHYDKVRGWVGFSVEMAHRITAGADILLMPSRFEPCGLNQLHGFMYGTVPVVHAVGGLRDTVEVFDPYNETGLGWTFESADANAMIKALGYCLETYNKYKESWEGLQRRGMAQELGWDNAAQQYEEVLLAAKYQW